jgi:L-arabinose isomerase
MAGGPHHTVMSSAVGTEELTDFARMVGVELLVIDGGTNGRDFANEIRWNQAAFKLGLGF